MDHTVTGARAWSRTVFDSPEWHEAWSRSTIEKNTGGDTAEPACYAVRWSPFWAGYEHDAGTDPTWDRPLLTMGTLYSFYGPSYLLNRPGAVQSAMERAADLADRWDTAGVLVANLPEAAAKAWSAIHPPDGSVRLDIAYSREVGAGQDPVVGDVSKRVGSDWRRRWRRATEQGLRLVEEANPDRCRVDEVIGLANGSATRHGWPPVYDATTARKVLAIPGSRLFRAEVSGQTVAGFVALEDDRTVYLWAGGTHPSALREVSPYLFVLYELLAAGEERGWRRIEFGRGNDAFKRRYGFHGTDTWSLWYARCPAEAPVYQARLATLHHRLSAVMGVPHRGLGQPDPAALGAPVV